MAARSLAGEAAGSQPGRRGHPSAKLRYLQQTDIFADFTPQEMAEVERLSAMTLCKRGKVFYTPGETGEVLFILKKGRVNLYRLTPDGKKVVTAAVDAGTVFGEMSLIGQGMYGTFAEAAEDCVICVMSHSDVERLLASKPKLALRVIAVVARRLQEAEARLEMVAHKSVPARLASVLLELARGPVPAVVDLTHQDLAEMVGTYRETVTRILNELRAAGVVTLRRRHIVLLRPEELRALAQR